MSVYIKLSTLEYPCYEGNIRLEHPEITEDQTYPNFPCPPTYAEVIQPELPIYDGVKQYLTQTKPANNNGVWSVEWVINNHTDEEIKKIEEVRNYPIKRMLEKNKKLNQNLSNSGNTPNAI
jgi:hypothetical protein